MKDALVFQILLHLTLDRPQTGEDICVSVNDTLGVARGAGGEDDLQRIVFRKSVHNTSRSPGQRREILKGNAAVKGAQLFPASSNQFRFDLLRHAVSKALRACKIDRHWNNTAQNAPEECGNPRRAVFAPDQNPVAFDDSARVEFSREASSQIGEAFIRTDFPSQTTAADNGDLIAMPFEIVNQRRQMWPQSIVMIAFPEAAAMNISGPSRKLRR